MRYAVISDIHANAAALRLVLESIRLEGVDRILCLGDIVGFHTSPGECIDLLRSHDVACIAGNHDDGVRGKLGARFFPEEAWESIEWTRKQLRADQMEFLRGLPAQHVLDGRIWIMHGTGGSSRRYLDGALSRTFIALRMKCAGLRMAFHGHTHRASCYRMFDRMLSLHAGIPDISGQLCCSDASRYIVNPGSVGQPRTDDTRATFLFFDTAANRLAWRQVAYDYAAVVTETLNTFPAHRHLYERFRTTPRPLRSPAASRTPA